MDHIISPTQLQKLRTPKEKVYYALVILVSIGIWGMLFFSIFRQIASTTSSEELQKQCFVRDVYNGSVTKTNPKYLTLVEKCLKWDELKQQEKDDLQESESSVVGKVLASITTPIYLILFFGFSLLSHLLALAYVRMNSIKVSSEQFPELYEALERLSAAMQLKKRPDMFIVNGNGVLNAFATRLVFRKLLIIYSNLAEALIEGKVGESYDQQQLEAVIGHELGHHALKHTDLINWFLTPGFVMPFLGKALSRAREYSADQVMRAVVPQDEACQRALVKLAAGRDFGKRVNVQAVAKQAFEETGFFTWWAEIISTHPFLPKRINAIQKDQVRQANKIITEDPILPDGRQVVQ